MLKIEINYDEVLYTFKVFRRKREKCDFPMSIYNKNEIFFGAGKSETIEIYDFGCKY